MRTFECALDVRAPALPLFRLSQDYARRLLWDPFLREARLLGAEEPAVGVRTWCVARNRLGMEAEYVTYRPPEVAAVRMTRGPWPIARFAGSWRFREIAPGTTRVTFRYAVAGRPRWLGFALDPLLAAIFACETRRRLAAFKRAAEESDVLTAAGATRG